MVEAFPHLQADQVTQPRPLVLEAELILRLGGHLVQHQNQPQLILEVLAPNLLDLEQVDLQAQVDQDQI